MGYGHHRQRNRYDRMWILFVPFLFEDKLHRVEEAQRLGAMTRAQRQHEQYVHHAFRDIGEQPNYWDDISNHVHVCVLIRVLIHAYIQTYLPTYIHIYDLAIQDWRQHPLLHQL